MPNHFDVDICLRELAEEDQRQKEALRKFLERERPAMFLSGKQLFDFICHVVFWSAVAWLLVVGLLSL